MLFRTIIGTLALVSAVTAKPVSLQRRSDERCTPNVDGKEFEIALASNNDLRWTLYDCIQPACTGVYLNSAQPISSDFKKWQTSGANGSVAPLNISTSANPFNFCVDVPTWGSSLTGRQCVAGQVSQEWKFDCNTCASAGANNWTFAEGCSIVSWDWGLCASAANDGDVVKLEACVRDYNAQTWDLVLA